MAAGELLSMTDAPTVFLRPVGSTPNGQQAGPEMTAGEDDDRTSLQVLSHGPEVRQEQRRLLVGRERIGRTNQDERRLREPTERKKRTEVCVVGDDDPLLRCRPIQDLVVRRIAEPEVPYRYGLMAGGAQNSGEPRRHIASTRNLTPSA